MNSQNKRIFISDLPETLSAEKLKKRFNNYGDVISVEIKARKELGLKNNSLYFAYVNLNTTDLELNKCFNDMRKETLDGHTLHLQLARESFLDQLKREREAIQKSPNVIETDGSKNKQHAFFNSDDNIEKAHLKKETIVNKKRKFFTSDDEDVVDANTNIGAKTNNGAKTNLVTDNISVHCNVTEVDANSLHGVHANSKRLKSLWNMKKGYNNQQNCIKQALSNLDKVTNKKITFSGEQDDTNVEDNIPNNLHRKSLFDEDSGTEQEQITFTEDFRVKKQFEGKHGLKLLELQSKYKNDKRFMLDERFQEDQDEVDIHEESSDTLKVEKESQLKILEEIMGNKSNKATIKEKSFTPKLIARFDPTRSDHNNLEIVKTDNISTKKMKIKQKRNTTDITEKQLDMPEVSKEVFYKVTNSLKETFEDKHQFSFLSTFKKVDNTGEETPVAVEIKSNNLFKSKNPFKYDSSDNEDEIEDIPHKDQVVRDVDHSVIETDKRKATFWTEPFFFRHDDYRLQEGVDFLHRMKVETKAFIDVRRELKSIVRTKVKNTEKKNRMFKKKLGGNRKKKNLRIKKALKR